VAQGIVIWRHFGQKSLAKARSYHFRRQKEVARSLTASEMMARLCYYAVI